METGPRIKVSSDRLVKPEIKPATPGLQDGEFIHYTTVAPPQRLLCFDGFETILYKYDLPLELFWDSFVFGLKIPEQA